MTTYFGVDSADTYWNLSQSVINMYRPPSFWGRYLPTYAIIPQEVTDLHANNIAILCIWNGETADTVAWSYDYGFSEGVAATKAWANLGTPKGTAIAVDVETPWFLGGEFARGWLAGVHSLEYLGAMYINPTGGNNHAAAYIYARTNGTAPGLIFSSEPEVAAWANTVRLEFTPDYPDGFFGDVGIHQYWENVPVGASGFDLDVASELGWNHLWHPKPLPPPLPPAPPKPPSKYTVSKTGYLKTNPSHSSKAAVDSKHNPVLMEIGAEAIPHGQSVKTDDTWIEITLPTTQIHGYYLLADLQAD